MNEKKRKILDVSEEENFFNLDIRVSIPKIKISQELVDDLLVMRNELVHGTGNSIYYAIIKQNDQGDDILHIGHDYFYGIPSQNEVVNNQVNGGTN